MAYIRLPNNRYFPIAEGETPEQAMQAAQQKYPKAFMSEKELEDKQGFRAATGEAFKKAKAGSYEAAGKLFNSNTLKQLAQQEQQELEEKPGFIPTTAEDREAAFKKGLFSGIGALGREYISEPVGGMVGRYGVPLGIGAGVAAAAPAVGVTGLGAAIAGGVATAAADYLPQVGENLERQRDTGKTENLSDASLAAIPQAALSGLNLRLGMLPKGVQNIFRADAAALQKQVIAGTLKPEVAVAQLSGNLKNILLSTGSAAVVGTGTMVGEEAIRRGQAGQSLTDAGALGDYADIGKGALALAPLFGVPRGAFKRGAEKRGIERAGQEFTAAEGIKTRAREDAEAAATADLKQAEELRTRQAETGDIFGEAMRTEGPAKGKQAFGKMEGDVSPFRPSEEAQREAGVTYDQRTVGEREGTLLEAQLAENRRRQANALVDTAESGFTPFETSRGGKALEITDFDGKKVQMTDPGALRGQGVLLERQIEDAQKTTPFEAKRQRDLLAQRVEEIETRVAKAAAEGDINTVSALSAQVQPFRDALKKAEVDVKAAGPIELFPAQQLEKMQSDLAKGLKELQKAGDLGDFDTINKLSPKLKDLQTKIAAAGKPGPDLFAVEKTAVEKEAVAKSKSEAETNAALAQGQQDLLAQIGKPETRVDAAQRKVLDRYQDSVRQLDEAYAANADKRIIDQLVDKVQADAAERAAIIAKISDTRTLAQEEAGQQRIARITRAIAEAEAKQDTASVAGLRNQLAKAIVDTARPQVENRRSKALEDQMAAAEQVRSAIEDLRSKRYLGEGTKDPSMAASLKSGVERQANEAVGRYVEAAIRDVQALREQNGQKKMTVTEATKMAMDIRGHLEKAVKNRNQAAFAIPKGDLALDRTRKLGESPERKTQPTLIQRGAVSPIERQLAQIKKKYHKGEPLKSRIEVDLKQEPDLLRKRQIEQGEVLNEALADAESRRKRTTRELEQANAAVAREKAAGTQPEQLPPNYYEAYAEKLGLPPLEKVTTGRMTKNEFKQRLLKEDLTRVNKEIKDLRKHIASFSNVDRVKTIEKRIAAVKEIEGVAGAGERLRLLEEKIQALEGQVNPDRNTIAQLKQAAAKERTLADKERVANETRERQGARSADESVSTIRTERETRQAERQREEQALRESKEEPLQKSLFGDKELESVATVRATPENFQRLLDSDAVQKLRAKLDSLEKPTPVVSKATAIKGKQQKAVGTIRANELALERATEAADKFKKAVANTEKYIQTLEEKLREVRTRVPPVGKPNEKPSPELIRKRKEVLNELAAVKKEFAQKGTSLKKQLSEQKAKLKAAEARVEALKEKTKAAEPLESFSEQLEKQRRFVAELADAENLADNLKNNAQQLWSMPATAQATLKQAQKNYDDLVSAFKKNERRRVELEKEIQIVMRQAEGDPFRAETLIRGAQDELSKIRENNAKLLKNYEPYDSAVLKAADSLEKVRAETPKRVAEIDRYHERATKLLEANIDTERAILKGMEQQYARMNAGSPQAKAFRKQMADLRKQTGIAEQRLAEFKSKQNATIRELEQSRAEFDKTAATFRQEIVSTVYRTQDVKLLKEKEKLRITLEKERDKPEDAQDQNKIILLERQIASLQTSREVLAKKQTSIEGPSIKIGETEVPSKIQIPPAVNETARREQLEEARLRAVEEIKEKIEARKESVETRKKQLEADLAAEREQKTPNAKKVERYENELVSYEYADLLRRELADELAKEKPVKKYVDELKADIASLESSYARKDLAERLVQESRLSQELKDVQAKIGSINNVIKGLEQAARKSTKPEIKKGFEERLLDARKQLEKLDQDNKLSLLDKEAKLKEQLADARLYGVNVEKALVALGDKPGREQKTTVKGPPLSAEQKAKIKKAKAARRQLSGDFEAYLESQKRDNFDYYEAMSGIKYRAVKEAPTKVDPVAAKQATDNIERNLPKDVSVRSVDSYGDLPEKIKQQLAQDGLDPQTIRGFIAPEGELYVIRGNHESIKDLERTYVHEIVGHEGVDRIIGREGMEALAVRVQNAGGAMALARKLNIDASVQGAINDYALTIKRLTEKKAPKERIDQAMRDMEVQIVRELVAYTAEKRVDEAFKQKAGRWLQEIVGAVRNWLRKHGFAELSKATTSDIYNLISQSQRNYNKGELGAMRDMNGGMTYRNKSVFSPNIPADEAATVGKVIAQDKADKDKIKGNVLGMSFMHRFMDRFAGLDYIARNMRDKLEGVQMMYYNRLSDQSNNMIAEIATHGSVGLEKNTDGTYQYKTRKGPSLKTVFESVNKAKSEFGNAQATLDYFGTYLAMERAAFNKGGLKAGLEKLDLSGKFSEADANAILKRGKANTNFQEARKAYREYNNGMLDLMVESGRLSKEQAVEMKKGDYVPYYRDRNGVIIDTENSIRVGDLKTQAYLKELMGGDSAIVNFETGALQNTYMLTNMAMKNIATKNTAYTLNKLGMADIKPGSGPAKANIIRFYENGKEMHAEISTKGSYVGLEARLEKMREAGKANTPEYKKLREKAEASRASEGAFGDIPAEMIVKGMEGVASVMPAGVSMMRGPADLLRKAVTRNPAYALRVAFKDSISGWVTSGADIKPVVSTLGSLAKTLKGGSEEVRNLQQQGIIGGHVFANTLSDMRTIAQQIAQGQSGWEKLWAKADRMGMMADEAQRVTLYNGFIKKGLSSLEASLATLESQNFTKHGYSPTIKALSTMIPFFNAQIQGLNAFGRAITGTSLFQDKLGVREQMLKRGMMLAAATMGYSALMQNNEAYQNATEIDKLNHWFIPLPFMDEPLRVPIPFETGLVFKAIPEAIYNLMATDAKSKDVLPAVGRQVLNSVPGMSNLFLPQGVKPVVELVTGTNLFTMQDIESTRQKAELAGYRSGANTTEASKALGKAIGVSPVQLDHAVNAYTSSLGIALLSMFNPLLRDAEAPDAKASQMPILGGFFQPTDAGGLIDKAYKDVDQIEKVNRTFKQLEESNPDEADRFLDKYLSTLDMASAAGKFKKEMGDINKEERLIRSDLKMTSAQKRAELDEIKQLKIALAKEFMSISRE